MDGKITTTLTTETVLAALLVFVAVLAVLVLATQPIVFILLMFGWSP